MFSQKIWNISTTSDVYLLITLKAAETANLKAVLISELPRLRRFTYSLTGNKADADDLLQSLIEKVLAKGFPNEGQVLPWLFRVCKNIWFDELRARNVRQNYQQQQWQPEITTDSTESSYQQQQLLEIIGRLPDEHRLVISLVIIEGFSYREAAAIMDCPTGTVMSRLARARQKLTLELKEHQHE